MSEEIFQRVFDLIQPVLPNEWEKMVLFVGYTAGSYTMKFYTSDKKGVFTDCFSQKEANKTQLIKTFMSINKTLSASRKELADKDRWTVMTMIVSAEGKMKAEFDYTDISENLIAYEQAWKEKYLK